MRLAPNFTVEEFTASDTAARHGIDNDLPIELYDNAKKVCEALEKTRSWIGTAINKQVPLIITSGYRSLPVNRLIGSKDTSDHIKAMAADIKCPGYGSAYELAKFIATNMQELGFKQVIYEFGSWVHVSIDQPTKLVNRILTIDKRGVQVGIIK